MKRERKYDQYGRLLRKDGKPDGRSGVAPTSKQCRARELGARLRRLCGTKVHIQDLGYLIQAQSMHDNDELLQGISRELHRIKVTLEYLEVDYRAACGMKPKENPYAD